MSEFNWQCPYCNSHQVVSDSKVHNSVHRLWIGKNIHGELGLKFLAIACANPECLQVQLSLITCKDLKAYKDFTGQVTISKHQIWPSSMAKPQPDYIPKPILNDYKEACLIRDLSPKASATLSRRCVQGIIRDFCGISRKRLVDEINELTKLVQDGRGPQGVSLESVAALTHVRSVGNIGAHMEKDIDVIVDVDPGEANALIEFIELLFEEWYVARQAREQRLEKLKATAERIQAKKVEQVPTAVRAPP